jgi:hypothetical protein
MNKQQPSPNTGHSQHSAGQAEGKPVTGSPRPNPPKGEGGGKGSDKGSENS